MYEIHRHNETCLLDEQPNTFATETEAEEVMHAILRQTIDRLPADRRSEEWLKVVTDGFGVRPIPTT